jgi:signal transduction histidine kinase
MVTFKERAMEKGVELYMDVDSLPETAKVDELKFKRIINNLLSNAVKFTSKGGSVNLKAHMEDCVVRPGRRQGDPENLMIVEDLIARNKATGGDRMPCLECSISDTGVGIKAEDQVRIFNIFEQLDGSSEKHYQGIGLGLSLAKRFVEMHGGRIWVESEGERKGSNFRFLIPV